MIVKSDETRKQTINGRSIDGFYISVLLLAAAVNQLIQKTQYGTSTWFDPSQISLKAILKRDGKQYTLFSSNLGILGQYNSLLSGAKNWLVGTDYVRPAAGVKHRNVRTVHISIGGIINLRGSDEIEFELTVGRNTFNASNLDVASCYVDINPSYAIGKEFGICSTYANTVQAGSTNDRWNLGDNVLKIAFLNFEDTDATSQIIQTLQLSSDRFDQSFNLADLINRHNKMFGKQPFNLPYELANPNAINDGFTPAYPQSFVIQNDEEIDKVGLDITFDGSKVNSSKNFIVYTSFITSLEILERSKELDAKHMEQNLSKLPVSL